MKVREILMFEEAGSAADLLDALCTGESGVTYTDGVFTWATGRLSNQPYVSLLQFRFDGDARGQIISDFSRLGIDLSLSSFMNINNQGGAGFNTIVFPDIEDLQALSLEDFISTLHRVTETVNEA